MKKLENPKNKLTRYIFWAAVALVFVFFCFVIAGKIDISSWMQKPITPISEIDSLRKENHLLRKLLAGALEDHCDTLTVEEKIAREKSARFSDKVLKEKAQKEDWLRNQKENAISNLREKKQKQDTDAFVIYYAKKFQLLKALQKKDVKAFSEYIICLFWCDAASLDESHSNYVDARFRLEKKQGVVHDFFVADSSAHSIREATHKKFNEACDKKIKNIESNYQAQQDSLVNFYQVILAKRAEQFGLKY